jgi:hypothetical protein
MIMMKRKMMMLAVAALLTICLSSVAAYADTLTFTLTDPNQSVNRFSGGTLTFAATVTAPSSNSGAVFLNSDLFSLAGSFAVNDDGFFNNFPLSLAPGGTFTGDLFTVTVPANTLAGLYAGSFTLLGGPNGGSSNVLGTANFSINAVPEPSSMILLVTGVAGGLTRFRKNFGGWSRKS